MSVTTPSPVRKFVCSFLAVAFVLATCLSGLSLIGPKKADAGLKGELIAGSICKVFAGLISHSLDEGLHYGRDKEGPDYDKALDEISARLESVEQALMQTEAEVKEIFAALKEMQFYATMDAISTNCAQIETFFYDEFSPRFLNKEAGTVPDDQVADFLDATGANGTTRPLENDFNQLAKSCTHESAGGVLDAYTDEVLAVQSGASDFATTVESTNGVGIVAERPMYFDYQGKWDGGSCQAGAADAGNDFYFAEGTTRPGFDTYLCILNPGTTKAQVKISYQRGDGTGQDQLVDVSAHSRMTVNTGDVLGSAEAPGSDFSAHVKSMNGVPIIAERPMYFNYKGSWSGGHTNIGARELSAKSFLAEGTCRNNFETYICIQNPNDTPSNVKATYLRSDGSRSEQSLSIPPRSRGTLRPSDVIGYGDNDSFDFSTMVETLDGTKVAVERPLYFSYKNAWLGGHCESGRVDLSPSFYFAEGTVRPGFHSYICLLNPSDKQTEAKVTFMLGDGTVKETTRAIPARSRATVDAAAVLGQADGPSCDFSAKVETVDGTKITAERAMYFDYRGPGTEYSGKGWSGGHCEMGLTSPGTRFHFAEGTIRPGFQPYICIQNPNGQAADVKVTYMASDGGVKRQSLRVPARSRGTINVAQVWNNLQVSGRGTQMSLTREYYGMENLFGQLFADQALALDMICEYRNINDPTKTDSDKFLNGTPGSKGAKAWLKEEMDCFMDNAGRMALSTARLQEDPHNPGTQVLVLSQEGLDIMDRANYLYQMVVEQAIDRFTKDPNADYETTVPVVAGTVFTTVDVNAPAQVYAVSAKDQAAGGSWDPTSTNVDSITWQQNDGMETRTAFYDVWSKDARGVNNAVVDYRSEITVTRFIFTGPNVVKGHKYDVSHSSQLLGTSTTSSYDDDFNPSDTGANIYGSLTGTVCNNGSLAFMDSGTSDSTKSNWSVPTNQTHSESSYGNHTLKNTYDLKLSDPTAGKTGSTDGKDSFSGCYSFDNQLVLARGFVPAQDVTAKVNCKAGVNLGVTISGRVSSSNTDFNSYYYFKLVEIDDGGVEHIMTATDTAGAPGQKHLKADDDSTVGTQSYSGNMTAETEAVGLRTGHHYQFQLFLHLDQNDPHQAGFGPTHLWSSATISTAYVTIVKNGLP